MTKVTPNIRQALALSCLLALLPLSALAADKDPPVPPDRDPGGVAVAIIGPGLDYTLPQISEHLARDGEGEIIGWDFVDNDRRPFKVPDDLEAMKYTHRGTAMARILLKRAPRARLEPVRIATGEPASVQKGLAFAAQTPALIAMLSLKGSTAALWGAVRDTMLKVHPKFLLVVAAGEDELDPAKIREHLAPAIDNLGNVIFVETCDHNGNMLTTADGTETNADIAVNTEAFTSEFINGDSFSWKPEGSIAASEIAAMAARLLVQDPNLQPTQLKAAILELAKPFGEGQVSITKHGWIAEPWKHFPAR